MNIGGTAVGHRHQRRAGISGPDGQAPAGAHRARTPGRRGPDPADAVDGRHRRPSAARSAPSCSISTRSPTTSGCWPRGRAPAWPRSSSRRCSRARASCRARSTRRSPRWSTRSATRSIGLDTTVALAAKAGQLELNVMMPVITHNIVFASIILANAVRVFDERCIRGIEADEAQCAHWLERSPALVTALAPKIGYAAAAKLAKEAIATGLTVKELVIKKTCSGQGTRGGPRPARDDRTRRAGRRQGHAGGRMTTTRHGAGGSSRCWLPPNCWACRSGSQGVPWHRRSARTFHSPRARLAGSPRVCSSDSFSARCSPPF